MTCSSYLFIVYDIYYFSHVFGTRKSISDGKYRFPVKFTVSGRFGETVLATESGHSALSFDR